MSDRERLDDAHALIFGVGEYLHLDPLPPAMRHGAEALGAVLSDVHHGGYRPDNVRVLVDAAVTREAILEELTILASLTGPQSTVVLYFAGHGGRFTAGGDEVYLLPVDADGSTAAALAATAVSASELAAALEAIPAGRLLLLLDCCHGGGLGSTAAATSESGGLPEGTCQAWSVGRGRVVLSSARGSEKSWLPAGNGLSFFTGHLLAALRGGAAGHAGWVRVWDLFEYLQPRVTADARANRHDQHPVFKADLDENFPVALALGGVGAGREEATDGYRYDAYVSYADREPDAGWVWETLVPHLEAAGLAVAVSGDVEEPGVFRVVGAERGITQARRTVVVLSEAYLEDEMTGFIDALAQTVGLEEGSARLLPVRFANVADGLLPARLRMLVTLDLHHPQRGPRNFNRLVRALQAPPAAGVASRAG
jgi:Caspase domain/TIR domain